MPPQYFRQREDWLDMSMSVTKELLSRWLDEVNDLIESALPPCSKIYVIIGGSLVSGLATPGSDLDLCTLVDDRGSVALVKHLESSFKQIMKELDKRLQGFGLHLCRLSRRIQTVNDFLQLHECHESKAALMRATVKMHYLISSRQVSLQCKKEPVQLRLDSERGLLHLKQSLWEDYKRAIGYTHFPILSSLLRRPGSYSPGRVLRQINVLVDNILLASSGLNQLEAIAYLSKPLEEKISFITELRTVACEEQRLLTASLREGLSLMLSAKKMSMVHGPSYRRSFHYLTVHGYTSAIEWRLIEETIKCLYAVWQCMEVRGSSSLSRSMLF